MESELTIYLETQPDPAPEWIPLLPLGEVALGDGRDPVFVDPEALTALVRHFHNRGLDLVIDYEHQTLSGGKAPAAGWIKELEAREDGLWARVEWTDLARRHLLAREYRYFSPVLRLEGESRRPTALLHAALTNTPAINHLLPLVAKDRGQGLGVRGQCLAVSRERDRGGGKMAEEEHLETLLERLQTTLGLQAETGAEEVLTRAAEKLDNIPDFGTVANLLDLPDDASPAQIKGAVLALKSGLEQLRQLQAEFAALKTDLAEREARDAVQKALESGKIQPSQRDSALKYARSDMEGFKTFVEKSLPVIPLGQLELAQEEGGSKEGGLSPQGLTVCEALGLAPEAFKAQARRLRADGLL